MKVILEAQHAVGHPQPRGVGHYSINLIQALLRRNMFDYELTFFDYNREVGNLERAEKYFGKFGVPFRECNDLDYRIASRDDNVWLTSYNDWTRTRGGVYHFTSPVSIPLKLDGKMIVTIHDIIWRSHPGMISAHASELLDMSLARIEKVQPYIIADSESARSQILEFTSVPSERISVAYLSYDEENIFPDKEKASYIVEGEYLLYLGAFETNKNIVRIIKAFNSIADKYRELKLVLAGKPVWDNEYWEQIKVAISNSPFNKRIVLPGYVDIETKRRLISNALCFVFPSICEGFGIPVLEAMACGCTVITADNTSLPEVGGDAVVYVNAYNEEQLAYEIERVVSSESLRKDMIVKGFVQAKRFSWEKTAGQVESVYQMVGNI
ncbi:glycosyltransferase family 4 protein [Lacrimispora sp.]|jgi:glycosyltransferase involved in cell wall biosynthesis|uniref:glycosyltransferase family 4 protein n=1 Tax=Lacrimispora sp. TaxID=2719234 RepID=UPI0028AB70BC|nr:glycosyltransferase family 1 protein [Lacrimispora sp.]